MTRRTIITGTYRSGSEYLCNLINSSSDICAEMYATNFLRHLRSSIYFQNKSLFRTSLERHLLETKNITFNALHMLNSPEALQNGVDEIFQILFAKNVPHWCEKMQLCWRDLSFFLELDANNSAIVITRNPLSVLSSFKLFTKHTGDAYLSSILNSLDCAQWLALNEKKYRGRLLVIKFEELITNKNLIERNIEQFLNCNLNEINAPLNSQGTVWGGNTTQTNFSIDKAINGWKEVLNENEVLLCNLICGENYNTLDGNKRHKLDNIINKPNLSGWTEKVFKKYLETGNGIQSFPNDIIEKADLELSI